MEHVGTFSSCGTSGGLNELISSTRAGEGAGEDKAMTKNTHSGCYRISLRSALENVNFQGNIVECMIWIGQSMPMPDAAAMDYPVEAV